MNPMIEVKNLKYKYPHTDKLVLDDINFTVEKGEFIGIVGANGAGKSTLTQALSVWCPNSIRGRMVDRFWWMACRHPKTRLHRSVKR